MDEQIWTESRGKYGDKGKEEHIIPGRPVRVVDPVLTVSTDTVLNVFTYDIFNLFSVYEICLICVPLFLGEII